MKIKTWINLALCLWPAIRGFGQDSAASRGWKYLPSILARISPPVFPARDYSILSYGAVADGKTDCLPAIRSAIDDCSRAGGGRVLIPDGHWFVKGPIHLLSNINLHLEDHAVVRFSADPDDFLPVVFTRYEGVEFMNYSPFLYAYEQHDMAVTGKGIFDGQADNNHWWNWCGFREAGWKPGMPATRDKENEPALMEMAARGVPVRDRVFGRDHYMRPSFVEFYRCENILIEGITITNAPFWVLHPTLSRNISIDGVSVNSLGPNNDGCDPESCTDVLIKNCSFQDGDDCIAIKSGRDADGRRVNIPCSNIVIQDCQMQDGHGAIVIGSETSGGVENIYAERCVMSSKNLSRAIRIKSNACRGGQMKNFYFRKLTVGEVGEAVIRINMHYAGEKRPDCVFPPSLTNVDIRDVSSKSSEYAVYIDGLDELPVTGVHIDHCRFNQVKKTNAIGHVKDLHIHKTTMNGKKIDEAW